MSWLPARIERYIRAGSVPIEDREGPGIPDFIGAGHSPVSLQRKAFLKLRKAFCFESVTGYPTSVN